MFANKNKKDEREKSCKWKDSTRKTTILKCTKENGDKMLSELNRNEAKQKEQKERGKNVVLLCANEHFVNS